MTCTRSARRHRAGEYWLGDVLVQRHNYQTNRRLEMTFPRLCTPPDEGRRPPRGPRSGKAFYSITLLSCGAPRTAGCTAWERRTVIKSSAAWKRLVGKLEEWKSGSHAASVLAAPNCHFLVSYPPSPLTPHLILVGTPIFSVLLSSFSFFDDPGSTPHFVQLEPQQTAKDLVDGQACSAADAVSPQPSNRIVGLTLSSRSARAVERTANAALASGAVEA